MGVFSSKKNFITPIYKRMVLQKHFQNTFVYRMYDDLQRFYNLKSKSPTPKTSSQSRL